MYDPVDSWKIIESHFKKKFQPASEAPPVPAAESSIQWMDCTTQSQPSAECGPPTEQNGNDRNVAFLTPSEAATNNNPSPDCLQASTNLRKRKSESINVGNKMF